MKPNTNTKMKIQEIELSKIKENPYQTRETIAKEPLKALTQSILQRGLINPISVLKDKESYIIISGHRRFSAYKSLKKKTIPCIVKPRQTNSELIIDLVHENLVREDLTPIEKGLSIKLLMSQIKGTKDDIDRMCYLIQALKNYEARGRKEEFNQRNIKGFEENDIFKVKQILRSINITENTAVVYLQALKLPSHMRKELSWKKKGYNTDGRLTIAQATQLVRVEDKEFQQYLFERCLLGQNQKRTQALVNEYKLQLENGTWKGFTKKYNQIHKTLKNPVDKIEELSEMCGLFSAKLRSFKIDTLIVLDETMEKSLFIASMRELEGELTLCRNSIDEKLQQKGFHEFRKDIPAFEIEVCPQIREKRRKTFHDLRFTFPSAVARELNLPHELKTKLKLKVVAIEDKK